MLAPCGPASAHAPIAGMGVFLSGAAHPFIAPALLLSLVALGLLMGQWAAGRIERARVLFGAYALALAAGLALQALGGEVDTDRLLLLCGAFAGATVAMTWRLPRSVTLCLAVGVGLATGMASGPTGVQGRDLAVMLAGTLLATLALPAWVLAVTSEVQRPWLKIAVRVLGSWLAAAALLVLSLTFAPIPRATASPEGGAARPMPPVAGARTPAIHAELFCNVCAAMPHIAVALVDGAGHGVSRDQPEAFNRLALAFLKAD